MAVKTFNTLDEDKVSEKTESFLAENGMHPESVDALILGYNGDSDFDRYYDALANGPFKETTQIYFKHLSGEFDTASGFGFWLGNKILKHQTVPEAVRLNSVVSDSMETLLIYNQYRGMNHSLTLLRKV